MSILFLAIVLVGIMAILFGVVALFRSTTTVADSTLTSTNFAIAHRALEQFASATGRLPCPANGTLATGDADPVGASATCNSPGGTLPWRTIGMRSEDALDAWGRKITYRVYTGNSGSLTQVDGVSMVKCECDLNAAGAACEPTPGAVTPLAGNAGGLCSTSTDPLTYNVTETTFLAGKGLTVNDFGTVVTDAAYVLVSHGPSGLGGYTSSGTATAPPANAAEINNMQPTGPFTAAAPMTAGLAPDDPAHFDDVASYQRLRDFIRRANLSARDWPEPSTLASVKLDTPTLTAALGAAPGADTGQSTINFGTASVTGTSVGAATDIAFGTSGGTEGIGVVGGAPALGPVGGITGTNTIGEKIEIDLTQKARKFAITLNDFGTYNSFVGIPGSYTEQVEFKFYEDGALRATVTKPACASVDGGLASFSIDIGAGLLFNRVDVRPISTVQNVFAPTTFFISEFATCAGSAPSCVTGLDTGVFPTGNRCP